MDLCLNNALIKAALHHVYDRQGRDLIYVKAKAFIDIVHSYACFLHLACECILPWSKHASQIHVQMLIKGIRSFSPDNTAVVEFYRPLTLIVGHNGAGKTVSTLLSAVGTRAQLMIYISSYSKLFSRF